MAMARAVVDGRTRAVSGQKSFTLHRSVAFEGQVQLIGRGHYGVWDLGTAKSSERLRIRGGPVVERDMIVRALLVRFHFECVEELYIIITHHHHQHRH